MTSVIGAIYDIEFPESVIDDCVHIRNNESFYVKQKKIALAVWFGLVIHHEVDNVLVSEKASHIPFKNIRPEYVQSNFDLIIEGESKQVYKSPESGNCYIILKNTIYSHSMQSTGLIENLGAIRGEGSRYFLEMAYRNNIKHSYICINNYGVIYSKFMENINPLEIVVKEYCEGTDKHSYYKYKDYYTEDGKYKHGPYVRFDWRNPNHLTENGVDVREHLKNYYKLEKEIGKEEFFQKYLKHPMGDKTISEHILKDIVDVDLAKREALKMFYTIKYYFGKCNLIIKDICFMLDGDTFWSEINQDCMRIVNNSETLDKDIWRSGGSSKKEQLISKWKHFNSIMKNYFKNNKYVPDVEYDYQKEMKTVFDKISTHKETYYELLRTTPRKFIVKYSRIKDSLFPDILVDFHIDDLHLYKKYFPHVVCENFEQAKLALENSARRVLVSENYSIPNKRKILQKFEDKPDLKCYINEVRFGNNILKLCKNEQEVEDAWLYSNTAIVHEELANQIWKNTFRTSNIQCVIQDKYGKIKEIKKFDNVPENTNKIIINKKKNNSVIFVVDKYPIKEFSNQFQIKTNLNLIQKHTNSNESSFLKLLQNIWKLESNPAEFVGNLLVYLNSKDIKLEDIQNELNSNRWNIFKNENKIKKNFLLIGITSSKYQQKTIDFLEKECGIQILEKSSKRSLKVEYNIVNDSLFKKHFNKQVRFISCRPKDMPWLMAFNRIDGAITYNTVMDNYPKVYSSNFTIPDNDLKLCLVKKAYSDIPKNPKIVAEHFNLIKKYIDGEIDSVIGSSESYLINSNYDIADCIVETGNTLKENNLEIHKQLEFKVKIGLFLS